MKISAILIAMLFLMMGCSHSVETLDDEIAALPKVWSGFRTVGTSSNNWAMLNRLSALQDANEKVRLVTALGNHFRDSPEWILSHDRVGSFHVFSEKMLFAETCAWRLISDTNRSSLAIFAGWRLKAAWIDDLERLVDMTEKDWNGGEYNRNAPQDKKIAWEFASRARRMYELYFKYSFDCFCASYRRLPETDRPAFAEQIKRDFFNRPGMKYVDQNKFPPEFRTP